MYLLLYILLQASQLMCFPVGKDLGENQLLKKQTFLPKRTAMSFAQTLALQIEDNLQVVDVSSPAAFATSSCFGKIPFFI